MRWYVVLGLLVAHFLFGGIYLLTGWMWLTVVSLSCIPLFFFALMYAVFVEKQ